VFIPDPPQTPVRTSPNKGVDSFSHHPLLRFPKRGPHPHGQTFATTRRLPLASKTTHYVQAH